MHNRRILIVDDNRDIHKDFQKILLPEKDILKGKKEALESQLFGTGEASEQEVEIEEQYELHSAFQGQEAVKMIESAVAKNEPYALVFMDARMPPGWDGIETIKEIWQKFPFTEVVLCTAFSDYSSTDIIRVLGATHRLLFLKKPFDRVAVTQMALAITTKWNFENDSRNYVGTLEDAVRIRTKELTNALSQLKEATQKQQELQNELLQSSKMSALGEMAAELAHEINSPLSVIQLKASTLQAIAQKDLLDQKEILQIALKIEETVKRIDSIIKGLRAFAHNQADEPFKMESIKRIVDDTLLICAEKIRNHRVILNVQSIGEDCMCECRATQIIQVLLNLFNNSLDAIAQLPQKWIKVEIKEEANSIEISVTDSGNGIPEAVREKMFKKFFTTKQIGKGTGLGLSISRSILEAHHGTFDLDTSCQNTRFILRFPRLQKAFAEEAA